MSRDKSTDAEINARLTLIVNEVSGGNSKKFAEKAGIKQGTFHTYMQGRTPNAETLKSICNTYKVNLNWLVAGIGGIYIEEKNNLEEKEAEVPVRRILLLINQWLNELTETDPGRDDWFRYNLIDAFPKLAAWLNEKESEGSKGELVRSRDAEAVT